MKADTFDKLWHDVLVSLDVVERVERYRPMPREWAKVELWQVVSHEQFGAVILVGPGESPLYPPYITQTTRIRVLWYYDEYTVHAYRGKTRRKLPTVIRPEPWELVNKTDQEYALAEKIVDHLDRMIRETLKDKDLCLPESRLVGYSGTGDWQPKWWRAKHAIVTDERSTRWFCLEHLCVPRFGDLPLSLYEAGFNYEQISKILRNEASKEEIEAWVAYISIQSEEV